MCLGLRDRAVGTSSKGTWRTQPLCGASAPLYLFADPKVPLIVYPLVLALCEAVVELENGRS